MSSLTLIRRMEKPASAEKADREDPLLTRNGKVIPSLGDPIPREPGAQVSFYFVIYPSKALAEKPELVMEFTRDGNVVAQGTPALPAPDEKNRIPYFTNVEAQKLPPGQYEVRAVVRQGASAAEQRGSFTIAQ